MRSVSTIILAAIALTASSVYASGLSVEVSDVGYVSIGVNGKEWFSSNTTGVYVG